MASPSQSLTLAEVAEASGIPKNTLRTWQRRYGLEADDQSEDGTSFFGKRTLARLTLIQQAIGLGHAASTAVKASLEDLEELAWAPAGSLLDRAWKSILNMNAQALKQQAMELEQTSGSDALVFEFALPLLQRVGHGWAGGQITVAHEHFASQVIEDLARPRQAVDASAPIVVLAVMPGEWHELSLSLGARLLADVGVRAAIVNEATDTDALSRSIAHCEATAAVLVRVAQDKEDFKRAVREVRAQVPSGVELMIAGNVEAFDDFGTLSSLQELKAWAAQRFPQ